MLYHYTARSPAGERAEGTVEAGDRAGALRQVEQRGLTPIRLTEEHSLLRDAAAKTPARRAFKLEWRRGGKPRMRMREVLLLTRELSDLLASGMTLGHALHTLSGRETGRDQDRVVAALRDEIIQGASLSESLAKRDHIFSPLYVSMVRAGEAGGRLAESLEQLCAHYERMQDAREKIVMALVYPSIVLIVGILTILFTMVFVVPRFESIFASLGSTLPLATQMLIGMSRFLIEYGWALAIATGVGVVLLRRWVRTEPGRLAWHAMLLRAPVIHRVVTSNAYMHFANTLGALLRNGVPVLDALAIVEDTVGNVVIARELRAARERVTDGSTLSGPLAQGRVFPRLLTDMLAVGEETGDVRERARHIARRYESELDRAVKLFTTVLEPVLILLIAVMVGFVAISMLLAVFDLTSGLNV